MEPVLLLNGIMMTTTSWVFQAEALEPHYRVVLHDFRGQLENLMPGPFTLQQHVDDLLALLDREGIGRAHLIGTSYGGEIGMMFAIAHPERVQSLAVIACASRIELPLRAVIESWRDTARTAPEMLYDVTVRHNFSPGMFYEAFLKAGRARLAMHPPEFFTGFADLCDAILTLDITDRLHEIQAPTLVIAAGADRLKPLHYSQTLATRIPNARLEVIPDAGHAVFFENAPAVNALLLKWLASQSRLRQRP